MINTNLFHENVLLYVLPVSVLAFDSTKRYFMFIIKTKRRCTIPEKLLKLFQLIHVFTPYQIKSQLPC